MSVTHESFGMAAHKGLDMTLNEVPHLSIYHGGNPVLTVFP